MKKKIWAIKVTGANKSQLGSPLFIGELIGGPYPRTFTSKKSALETIKNFGIAYTYEPTVFQ